MHLHHLGWNQNLAWPKLDLHCCIIIKINIMLTLCCWCKVGVLHCLLIPRPCFQQRLQPLHTLQLTAWLQNIYSTMTGTKTDSLINCIPMKNPTILTMRALLQLHLAISELSKWSPCRSIWFCLYVCSVVVRSAFLSCLDRVKVATNLTSMQSLARVTIMRMRIAQTTSDQAQSTLAQ